MRSGAGKAGRPQQVALGVVDAGLDGGEELGRGLDALGDRLGVHLPAERDDRAQQLERAIAWSATDDQLAVQLDDLRPEVGDVLQVRESGSEVVDGERHALLADFRQHAVTLREVLDGHRLGDLHGDRMPVPEHRVVGAHQPTVVELVRVDVEVERVMRTELHGLIAMQESELRDAPCLDRGLEQVGGALENRIDIPRQRLVGQDPALVDVRDRLEDDADVCPIDEIVDGADLFGGKHHSVQFLGATQSLGSRPVRRRKASM